MSKTLKLMPTVLSDTIVARNYVIKRPIIVSQASLGVYEIALLDFTPGAATIMHSHPDDTEMLVNLHNCNVTICPKGGVHNVMNTSDDYVPYLSVKCRHPFSTEHLQCQNETYRLIRSHVPEECIEGDYVSEWVIYDNPGSTSITKISYMSFGTKSSFIIKGDNEHNVMMVNTETFEGIIIPKNESMTITNKHKPFESYIKIRSLVPFTKEDFK